MATPASTITATITGSDGTVTTLTGTVTLTQTPPAAAEPAMPSAAVVVDMLPFAFACNHDAGTPGSATGTSTYPATAPDGTANCRELQFTLVGKGGFIYHGSVMKDASAYNTFCLETEELSTDWSNLNCVEKDMEQVSASGVYVDMATQLNGNSKTLDYTANQSWQHTTVKANPTAQPANVWIPTRRYFRNNGDGTVTYIGSFDNGTYSLLNITVKSQPSAKWAPNDLNLQIQYDGASAGSVQSTVWLRVCRVHCYKT